MLRVAKRSAAGPIKTSAPRVRQDAPPRWIPPQLCQLVEIAPSDRNGSMRSNSTASACPRASSTGACNCSRGQELDWSDKYPTVIAALAKVRAKTSYLDGELCGIGDDGLPSFSQTQAATDGSRGMRLVYYVFDLLHLDGGDTASLPLIERKALVKPLIADVPGLQFNDHEM